MPKEKPKPEQTLIGWNLERMLLKHGLTHRALAERTRGKDGAVTHVDVSRIKSGETPDPSANKLKAMADAMGEDLAAFWASRSDPTKVDATIQAVIDSGVVGPVNDQDKIDLASSRWRIEGAPPEKVFHVLQIIRIERGERQ